MGDPTRSVAAQLVELARDTYTLGVTPDGQTYGVHTDRPHIALPLRGGKTGMRQDLSRRYHARHGIVPSQQALADALMTLDGYAAEEQPRQVYLRVATHGGSVYIDMGDIDAHVVEISGGAWDIHDRAPAPVLYRRTKLTGVMPKPYVDGDISRMWEFAPVPIDDRPLVLAWLVQTLIQPATAHPVLLLAAEHGSGKTSAARCLVALADPSPVPVRKAPRDAEGWVTAANASWVVALDNLSGVVPMWLSDSLCRAVTGDGDVRRALYSDADVSVMAYRRAVIITGIDVGITQGDLADRLVRVELPRIPAASRRSDEELDAAWVDAYPDILGGLLTLAAEVHHRLPSVDVAELPRMADYGRVLAAADAVMGTAGLARYAEQSRRVAADTLDAPLIGELVARRYLCDGRTSADVLADLTPSDRPRDWPRSARAVTGQLTRHAPALRAQGWTIEHDGGRRRDKVTRWTIAPPETARITDPHHPQTRAEHHHRSSDGIDECGSECGSERGSERSAGYDRGSAGYGREPDPHLVMPLTSDNGSAGHAGHGYGPSLVTSPCSRCGQDMYAPASVARGHCERCHLASAANTGGRS